MTTYTIAQIVRRARRLADCIREVSPATPDHIIHALAGEMARWDLDAFEAAWARRKSDFPDHLSITEGRIISKLLDTIFANPDLYIEVRDEEGKAISATRDEHAVEKETAQTGQTTYLVFAQDRETRKLVRKGFIWLVHGNEADVITDLTDSEFMHDLIGPATALAEDLQ